MDPKKGLPSLPNNILDLSIQSPPYNLGKNYDVYKDNRPYDEFISELKGVFGEVYRVTKSGGRCCINVGDLKNGKVTLHSDIIQFMKDLKWMPYTTIIWDKHTCSSRTSWGSFMSPSSPSFPTPFEYILVFAKDSYKKVGDKANITIEKQSFIRDSLALWSMGTESRSAHPAPFPLSLPLRLINMLSYKGDLVADFYSGSGTTATAAVRLRRGYLGYELSKEYYKMSIDRIDKEKSQLKLNLS